MLWTSCTLCSYSLYWQCFYCNWCQIHFVLALCICLQMLLQLLASGIKFSVRSTSRFDLSTSSWDSALIRSVCRSFLSEILLVRCFWLQISHLIHIIYCGGGQIRPLIAPTKQILRATDVEYRWHEFFPNGMICPYMDFVSIWPPRLADPLLKYGNLWYDPWVWVWIF